MENTAHSDDAASIDGASIGGIIVTILLSVTGVISITAVIILCIDQ